MGGETSVEMGGARGIDSRAFSSLGWAGPVRVFTPEQCDRALRHHASGGHGRPEWHKGWAAVDPVYHELATRPALLEIVRPLLGPDVVLWGANVVSRGPGQTHACHSDMESAAAHGRFASLWVGLCNTSRDSGLRLIPGSHRYGKTVQELRYRDGATRAEDSDESALAWAREHDPGARIVAPEVRDGETIVFDGRLWHASANRMAAAERLALLLQYAAADSPVYRPLDERRDWPLRFDERRRPPVITVCGTPDEMANRTVRPPSWGPGEAPPVGISSIERAPREARDPRGDG